MKPRHAPPAFPEALDGDDDDVAWALSTGGVEWNRGAHAEALVWLKRAIEAARSHRRLNRARDLEFRGRTLQVALEVGWVSISDAPPPPPPPPPVTPAHRPPPPSAVAAGRPPPPARPPPPGRPPPRERAPSASGVSVTPTRASSATPAGRSAYARGKFPSTTTVGEDEVELLDDGLVEVDVDLDAQSIPAQPAEEEITLEQDLVEELEAIETFDDADVELLPSDPIVDRRHETEPAPPLTTSSRNSFELAPSIIPSAAPSTIETAAPLIPSIPPSPFDLTPSARSPATAPIASAIPASDPYPSMTPESDPTPSEPTLYDRVPRALHSELPPRPETLPPTTTAPSTFPPSITLLSIQAPSTALIEEEEATEREIEPPPVQPRGNRGREQSSVLISPSTSSLLPAPEESRHSYAETVGLESLRMPAAASALPESLAPVQTMSALPELVIPLDTIPALESRPPESVRTPARGRESVRAPEAELPPDSMRAPAVAGVLLSSVAGLQDLPEDSQSELVRRAEIQTLNADEEIGGFGLALVIEGSVAVMPTVADVAAAEVDPGQPVFSQGHLSDGVAVRVVAGAKGSRVAVWSPADFEAAVRDCPWVGDELKAVGDRFQALAGAAMGPLGESLDDMLRTLFVERCEVKLFLEGELLAEKGKPLKGMFVLGGGHLEIVDPATPDSRVLERLGSGDFLFASQILGGAPAPANARAGAGGALVLFAPRAVAHELMVSVPPLLEIFAR